MGNNEFKIPMDAIFGEISKILRQIGGIHGEIEYCDLIDDCKDIIDVRIYKGDIYDEFHDENYENHAKMVFEKIQKHSWYTGIIAKCELYTPHPDSVKFGFSGIPFTGIEITVNLDKVNPFPQSDVMISMDGISVYTGH